MRLACICSRSAFHAYEGLMLGGTPKSTTASAANPAGVQVDALQDGDALRDADGVERPTTGGCRHKAIRRGSTAPVTGADWTPHGRGLLPWIGVAARRASAKLSYPVSKLWPEMSCLIWHSTTTCCAWGTL
jgi:hypothetical protein